jgi:hypothetical protein
MQQCDRPNLEPSNAARLRARQSGDVRQTARSSFTATSEGLSNGDPGYFLSRQSGDFTSNICGILRASDTGHIYSVDRWLPNFDLLFLLCAMVILERIYTYRNAVFQRSLLTRDIISSVVNLYVTGVVTSVIVLPALTFFTEYFLGRKMALASPEQLGPVWLQIPVILLSASFVCYWVHRLQHTAPFFWELHAYHHRTTDPQASNIRPPPD